MLLGAVLGAGALSIGAGLLVACRREGSEPPDRGKILSDLVEVVIVPSYSEAAADAKKLEDSLAALRDTPTAEALTTARSDWRRARTSWKATDAFLFGPADDLAITSAAIDTPADSAKVEALMTASSPLDSGVVGKLGANQRGFPAIEVLLFDPAKDDGAMLASFQAEGHRRGTLAALLGADLRGKIEAVRDAWSAGSIDYGAQLARAGRGSTVYAAERQGIDAVVNALIAAAEVLVAVRLAKPLGIDKTPAVPAPDLVESPRSNTSVEDILAVLDGIEAVYQGQHGGRSGLPLAAAVADRSPGADERMRLALDKARQTVQAIPRPLRSAVVEHRDPVLAAHAAVRDVKRTLMTDVAGALGTSVGFNVTDGD
jgi:predicted lipoprotein